MWSGVGTEEEDEQIDVQSHDKEESGTENHLIVIDQFHEYVLKIKENRYLKILYIVIFPLTF